MTNRFYTDVWYRINYLGIRSVIAFSCAILGTKVVGDSKVLTVSFLLESSSTGKYTIE